MKRAIFVILLAALLLTGFSALSVSAQAAPTAVVTAYNLNVRDYPDPINATIIARIGRGEVYAITARSSFNNWWQLRLPDGRLGWVNGSYIDAYNTATVPVITPSNNVPSTSSGQVTAYYLNVRSAPDPVNGSVLLVARRFETYPVIGRTSDSQWWQVRINDGRIGWVRGTYFSVFNPSVVPVVSVTPTPNPTPAPVAATGTVTAYFLNVRSAPNPVYGSILVVVGRNQTFSVTGRTADSSWWRIQVGNVSGWVSGRYLSVNNAQVVPVAW